LYGAQENDIDYWMGCVYDKLNEPELAKEHWLKASVGLEEPAAAVFYNDQQPDRIFYQGMALLKLGKEAEANTRFNNLIRYGKNNMNKQVKIDYFAVSLPDLSIFDDDLNMRNNIHCHYLLGLGYLGLKNYTTADNHFNQVLKLDSVHIGCITNRLHVTKDIEETPGAAVKVTAQTG
jgi:tetratricopeptide (TPR) repeat protein